MQPNSGDISAGVSGAAGSKREAREGSNADHQQMGVVERGGGGYVRRCGQRATHQMVCVDHARLDRYAMSGDGAAAGTPISS